MPAALNQQLARSVVDNGARTERIESVYMQDEYRLLPTLTINYGARFDNFDAFTSGKQLSPRLNLVWQALPDTTVHGGYSRYFSPPRSSWSAPRPFQSSQEPPMRRR